MNASALIELREKHGVQVRRTPDDIHGKVLESWDKIVQAEMQTNEFFKKVIGSQRSYASLVVPARSLMYPPYEFAAQHYWSGK